MNPTMYAIRLGLIRGWIETKNSLRSREDQIWIVLINAILITVVIMQRGSEVAGVPLAAATLPGLLGMNVVMAGVASPGMQLSMHREDGTLLRAKATPNGMIGYITSGIAAAALGLAVTLLLLGVAGLFVVDELRSAGVSGWLAVTAFSVLGLLATLPWGLIIGSMVGSSAAGFGLTFLPVSLIIAISGIFYPITGLPGWLQAIGQVFPVYWLGLGMRSALLPDAAVAAELGESWRTLETLGVLGLWAVIGLALAPPVLRRMSRRESGSAVEERKQRALQRGS